MFNRLRNKFIFTNMLITTAILLVAFSGIYLATTTMRRPEPREMVPMEFLNTEMERIFEREIKAQREDSRVRLLATLLSVGVLTELLVFGVSWYLAEKSIKPVREAYEKQREFIANASHELKTPIAAIQANFEALGADEQPWTENIETELTRANNLVQNLLTLARTDGRLSAGEKKEVDIVKLVQKRAKLIEARLGEKKLNLDLPEKAMVKIVSADAAQILDILLDNAVKYSKSEITVRANAHGISVANDGKKIAKDKLERVFDRFYQTDKTAEGSGLGLAIAKSVAEQNGWGLRAECDEKTTFSLSF